MLMFGSVLMALAILGFFEVGAFLNRKEVPSWTRSSWVGEAVALLFVFIVGVGTVSMISGLVSAAEQGWRPADIGLAAGMCLGAVLFARGSVPATDTSSEDLSIMGRLLPRRLS